VVVESVPWWVLSQARLNDSSDVDAGERRLYFPLEYVVG
jgi:hypothetical protein